MLEFIFEFCALHTAAALLAAGPTAWQHTNPAASSGHAHVMQALLFFIHSRIAFYRILRRRSMRWKPTFIHWRLFLQKCWGVIEVLFLRIVNRLITKKTQQFGNRYATTLTIQICIRKVPRSNLAHYIVYPNRLSLTFFIPVRQMYA